MKTIKQKSVEETLVEMLKENTGIALCDSGGDGGRMWQRNSKKTLRSFENAPTVTWDYEYGGGYTISVYHYLKRALELDALCHEFNSEFVPSKDWDAEGFYGVSAAGEAWIKDHGFKIEDTFNSYNGESNLSQVIQGTRLELGDRTYLLLQIHGGADVRGGYTDARLFYVPSFDDGIIIEDVYGVVTKKDGTEIEVDNRYNGSSLTTENGEEVNIEDGDKVELYLAEC